MSYLPCSYCGDFADTDNGCGSWDIQNIRTRKVYEFVCGICEERFVTEDRKFDPELERAA